MVPSHKKWQFVVSNQSQSGETTAAAKRVVREHAMLTYRRIERMERTMLYRQMQGKRRLEAPVDGANDYIDYTGDAANETRAVELKNSIHKEHSLPMDLDYAMGNTLSLLPSIKFLDSREDQHLFLYFLDTIAPVLQPFCFYTTENPIITAWAQNILADPALLRSVFFHAAVHIDACNQRPWSRETITHRVLLIEQLKPRLNRLEDATLDSTIAAVGVLAGTGNITGNVDEDEIHKNAWLKMVGIRGGIDNLGWDGALELFLTSGALIASTITWSQPSVDYPNITSSIAIIPSFPREFIRPPPASLELLHYQIELQAILATISQLLSVHSILRDKSISTAHASTLKAFSQLCLAVEYRLLYTQLTSSGWSCRSPSSESSPSQSSIAALQLRLPLRVPVVLPVGIYLCQLSRIAALMCVSYHFRTLRRSSVLFCRLRREFLRVMDDVDALDERELNNEALRTILWACWIVVVVTDDGFDVDGDDGAGQPHHLHIQRCVGRLGYVQWNQVESCLLDFVWSPSMHQQRSLMVWDRVTARISQAQ